MTGTVPDTAALVGAGVIGAGWTARFALCGIEVRVHDPHPDTGARIGRTLDNARRAWAALGWGRRREGAVRVVTSLEAAVDGVGFVQESLPEALDLKMSVLAAISRVAPRDALIASSTSGLLPTGLAADMEHPGRFVVGHPFVPPYLIPLVEVCGGEATAPEAVERALGVYAALGMQPLHVRHEVDGFIADRLMEAMWREALHLINDGVATAAEIDDAIRFGPGLRWAFMGPFLTYRIAGGDAGMRHFMAQFGPALKWPWSHLQAPDLTDALVERIAEQSDQQAASHPAGGTAAELELWRDTQLVALLSVLANRGEGTTGS